VGINTMPHGKVEVLALRCMQHAVSNCTDACMFKGAAVRAGRTVAVQQPRVQHWPSMQATHEWSQVKSAVFAPFLLKV
jgi:hypothetical protein